MGTFVAVALGTSTCLFRGYRVDAKGTAWYGQNEKVTLLPAESVESTRRLVADGGADRVSGFIRYVVQVALDDATGWAAPLGQALIDAGER